MPNPLKVFIKEAESNHAVALDKIFSRLEFVRRFIESGLSIPQSLRSDESTDPVMPDFPTLNAMLSARVNIGKDPSRSHLAAYAGTVRDCFAQARSGHSNEEVEKMELLLVATTSCLAQAAKDIATAKNIADADWAMEYLTRPFFPNQERAHRVESVETNNVAAV
ncbi:MAG: hypothetical protein Q8O98_01710 [bacterium]|nr:hypothetical protein [bacterium]